MTIRLDQRGNDEFSELSYYFNLTIGKIRAVLSYVTSEVSGMDKIGISVAANMLQTSSAMRGILSSADNVKKRLIIIMIV